MKMIRNFITMISFQQEDEKILLFIDGIIIIVKTL